MKRMHPSIWLVGAFIYFVCPLDGDFAFPIGFIDDVLVAVLCIKKFCEEMEGPGPGQPAGMPVDAVHRKAAPKIQSPLDFLVTAKGNPGLN